MYEPHPVFDPPPAEAKLWRYMDLTKLIALLDSKSLYFARADLLGDDWEGAASRFNIKMRPFMYQMVPEEARQHIFASLSEMMRLVRPRTYVSCWHMNQHESDAMWKLYMKDAGIAVQTSFERLKQSMAEDKYHRVYIGIVRYIDYDNEPIPEGNNLWPFIHKRASFRHENEVRAIIRTAIPFPHESPPPPVPGITVPVNIEKLVESVVIAPKTPPWIARVIHSVLKHFDLQRELQQSSLSEEPEF